LKLPQAKLCFFAGTAVTGYKPSMCK